jgi:hypothetical protein
MFGLSFTALFLELMVIRWVPSVVTLVAYYANLMLLSSFLGLGVGALAAERKTKLFSWFPVFLAGAIGTLLLCRNIAMGTSGTEARFYAEQSTMVNVAIIVLIFAANALLFVPLGQRMGTLFIALPRLSAYGWDLAGSLCGTFCFGMFSLKLFSPVAGMAVVMVIYLLILPERRWLAGISFAALLGVMGFAGDRNALWSPYHFVTIHPFERPNHSASAPPADLRTMANPPVYVVKVNRMGYHYDATFDAARYPVPTFTAKFVIELAEQYDLPYRITPGRERVLVVGAGGGADVEAGLRAGAKHIDAIEIDPAIIAASNRFNAGAPYANAKVRVVIDDARSFIKHAKPGYDLVVFGFLDSQALFSSMSNVRLDGYVYTVESLRAGYELLNERGVMALSFHLGADWLGPKLVRMLTEATGREPAIYLIDRQMVLVVSKDPAQKLPLAIGRFTRARFADPPPADLATDDWPYLYLIRKTIPSDYLWGIGSLLGLSLVALGGLRRGAFGREDLHFAFLGMAFMLLETKSISDCTLFFGATWLVTMIVIVGVLLMVMLANLVATRIKAFSFWMHVPLFAVLVLLFVVPREQILGLGFVGRLLWTLLAVPLPVFFAGIIFSTTFREAKNPAAAFGANLIGAMVGGFCEYLAMAIGSHRISLLVVGAYAGSLLMLYVARRRGPAIAAP